VVYFFQSYNENKLEVLPSAEVLPVRSLPQAAPTW